MADLAAYNQVEKSNIVRGAECSGLMFHAVGAAKDRDRASVRVTRGLVRIAE